MEGRPEQKICICTTQQWSDAQSNADMSQWYGPFPRMFLDYDGKTYEFEVYASITPYDPTFMFLHVCQFKQSIRGSDYPDKGKAMHSLFPRTLTGLHLTRWTDYFSLNLEAGEEVTGEREFDKAVAQCVFSSTLVKQMDVMKLRAYLLTGERFPDDFSIKEAVRSLEDMSNGIAFLTTDVCIQPLNQQELKFALLTRMTYKNLLRIPDIFLKSALSLSLDNLVQKLEEMGCGPQPTKTDKRKLSPSTSDAKKPSTYVSENTQRRDTLDDEDRKTAKRPRMHSPKGHKGGSSKAKTDDHEPDVTMSITDEKPKPTESSIHDFFAEIIQHPDFRANMPAFDARSKWAKARIEEVESLRINALRELMYNLIDLQHRFQWTDHETTFILWFGVETMEDFAREEILWDYNID